MIEPILKFCNDEIEKQNKVRIHISKLDTDKEYDAVIGVYVNDKLKRIFELENITNPLLEEYQKKIIEEINKKKLYLI